MYVHIALGILTDIVIFPIYTYILHYLIYSCQLIILLFLHWYRTLFCQRLLRIGVKLWEFERQKIVYGLVGKTTRKRNTLHWHISKYMFNIDFRLFERVLLKLFFPNGNLLTPIRMSICHLISKSWTKLAYWQKQV